MLRAPDDVSKAKMTGDLVVDYLRDSAKDGPYNEDMG